MKIIDLFYNIMTDEKVPQKIKYHNKIWELGTNKINGYFDYINCNNRATALFFANYLYSNSNDEVEILEEEKKIPEKLEEPRFNKGSYYIKDINGDDSEISGIERTFRLKINEIIDYLKSKGE